MPWGIPKRAQVCLSVRIFFIIARPNLGPFWRLYGVHITYVISEYRMRSVGRFHDGSTVLVTNAVGERTMETTLDNIEKSRNTAQQLDWYKERQAYLDAGMLAPHRLADVFPVFASRQKVTRFVETLRYWELIDDVPGSIFECGVAGGEFLMAMAHFSSIYEPQHYTRKIVGFDTFSGFTPPSSEDKTSGAEHLIEGGLCYDSYEYLKRSVSLYDGNRMIGNMPKVFLEKGDISETLPRYLEENPATVVSLLHLDLDLYKPTADVLSFVLERMPKGSLIVFDEINHSDYPGETLAVMEKIGLRNIELKRVKEASSAGYARV